MTRSLPDSIWKQCSKASSSFDCFACFIDGEGDSGHLITCQCPALKWSGTCVRGFIPGNVPVRTRMQGWYQQGSL
eukprot:5875508-Amphidinium_carterae.1